MIKTKLFLSAYYKSKPYIPRHIQLFFRRQVVALKRIYYSSEWPILEVTSTAPKSWPGWPEGKKFAVVLTHDVDTAIGQGKCIDLMQLEIDLGFRSCFNFVPERYTVSEMLLKQLVQNGFEIGVHGLNHDGKLYSSRHTFKQRALKINKYLKQWKAVGFRSPAMHHNLDWIRELKIEYDCSTFDTDPFEPQSDGVGSIFPFWVEGNSSVKGYVELPYTLVQDFTLFVLMKEQNIDVWQKKLDWIVEKGGMVLLNTHPDYMCFNSQGPGIEEYPAKYYQSFLEHVKNEFAGRYWHVLPRELARFWVADMVKGEMPD